MKFELAQGPWSRMMSKVVFAALSSAIMACSSPAVSWGQSPSDPCACACSVVASSTATSDSQVYRRFSYEPATSVQGNMAMGTVITPMQPTSVNVIPPANSSMQSLVTQPQVFTQSAPMQSYRRYSYQPTQSATSTSHATDQPWRYAKTDPRRYR